MPRRASLTLLEAKIRELSPFGQFDSIFDSFFGGPGDET